MRPIFDKVFPSCRKRSRSRTTPSVTAPRVVSGAGRGSKTYLRGYVADDRLRRSDEESGYSMTAVRNQDKGRSSSAEELDQGIIIATQEEVERR